jgi:hypothetical protein
MGDIGYGAGRQASGAGPAEADSILHPLADELITIANRLREAATGDRDPNEADHSARPRPSRGPYVHLALARKAYALRRKRTAIFGNPDLFGEPAWDILLDLFIAHGEGKPVSVSSACIGSAAPATTGLRWLGVLADEGLVVRENDPEDHRRVLVRLTPAGRAGMERFFDTVDLGA